MGGKTRIALLGLGVLVFAPVASAEPGAGPASNDSKASAPSTAQSGGSDSLSTKLNKSGGVIQPKGDVDPGIKTDAPVPNPGSTPVVPPSATGGDSAK